MQPDQAVIKQWSTAAPYWEKHRALIGHMFAPITDGLVEAAQIVSGSAVLDVATGPGEPALNLAPLVGPTGKIVGVDPIPGMVEAARRTAEYQGLRNVQFEVAFADDLPFPDATFDAVICRFGVMFFPSPADGVREILRVLKPGRKLALAAWYTADTNPFFHTFSRVIDRYVPVPTPGPDAPDAMRFAVPGKLLDVLSDAGVAAPAERLLRLQMPVPLSLDEFWTLRLEMSEKLRDRMATLSQQQEAEVKAQVFEALGPYVTDAGLSLPTEVLIASGSKGA